MSETPSTPPSPELFGILAEFKNADGLLAAARRVRDRGFVRWDAYSPYPVHGLERAMGVRSTRLPAFVLAAGILGALAALLMQGWMNGVDYPLIVAGKPLWSVPAQIPIIFEAAVLCAGITAFLTVLIANLLPEPSHPFFSLPRFRRATDDRFFLGIEAKDPRFDEQEVTELLRESGAVAVEHCPAPDAAGHKPPRALVWAAVVLVVSSFVPLAIVARARVTTSTSPRLHAVLDMDAQPKVRAQRASAFFADGRGSRAAPPGAVAVDDVMLDLAFARGGTDGAWLKVPPKEVPLSEVTMRRGQERFGVFCAPCHGVAGGGDGLVARRALELKEGSFVPPASMSAPNVRAQPLGQIVNSITLGIRNMPAYGPQIPAADRWAVALYVRALGLSQAASVSDVPAEVRPTLR